VDRMAHYPCFGILCNSTHAALLPLPGSQKIRLCQTARGGLSELLPDFSGSRERAIPVPNDYERLG
jgi:hypothetical protein